MTAAVDRPTDLPSVDSSAVSQVAAAEGDAATDRGDGRHGPVITE